MPVTFGALGQTGASDVAASRGNSACAMPSIRLPERVLLHLSDTHLRAAGSRLFDRVDATERLKRALDVIEASGVAPDGIVFTGDLVDLGEGDAYAELRAVVDPFAGAAGHPRVLGDGQSRRPCGLPRRTARRAIRRSGTPRRSRRRARRPASGHPRLDRARLPPRRAARRAARMARGRARHPCAARDDPRDAPPAGAERAAARRDRRAARPGPPRRRCCAAPTCARSSQGTCTTRRSRPSPASPSRSPHRPATRRISRCRSAAPARRTGLRRSTSCTCTTTRSCTPSSRSTFLARSSTSTPDEAQRRIAAAGIATVSSPPTEPIAVLR